MSGRRGRGEWSESANAEKSVEKFPRNSREYCHVRSTWFNASVKDAYLRLAFVLHLLLPFAHPRSPLSRSLILPVPLQLSYLLSKYRPSANLVLKPRLSNAVMSRTFSNTPYFDDRGMHGSAIPITERINVCWNFPVVTLFSHLGSLIHDPSYHTTRRKVSVLNITGCVFNHYT